MRSALLGALSSAAVLWWAQSHSPLHFLLYAVIGVTACVALGWLASLVLPGKRRELGGLTWPTRRGG